MIPLSSSLYTKTCSSRLQHIARTQLRCMHRSIPAAATPIAHPTIAGAPPPPVPEEGSYYADSRIARRKRQAAALKQGPQNSGSRSTSLSRRFWREVSVQDVDNGLQIHLDKRAVRTPSRQALSLPYEKKMLAGAIAMEWDQLVTAQQALKQQYIPLTSLVSRSLDIQAADDAGDNTSREGLVKFLLKYLATDTLLCWAPEIDLHDPDNRPGHRSLRERQKQVAEPIIAYLKTHVFPGVEIEPILSEDSIVPLPQPELTVEVIRGWMSGLPAFELAALERAVLTTKSLLISVRLLVEWSSAFKDVAPSDSTSGRFGIEHAAEASSLEVQYQTEQWGPVEDTHDVDAADIRRQLGSVILLIS